MRSEANQKETSMTARAAWLLCARMLVFLFSFALPLLLVRRLNQHDFGLYKQLFLVVGTLMTTLPMGFGMSAFYFLPREREAQAQIVFNIVLFQMFVGSLACLTLFLYPQSLAVIFKSSLLIEYAPFIGLIGFTWIIAAFLEVVVIANQEPKLATVLIVVSQLSKTILLLTAAVFFGSVWALIYAALIQGVLQAVLLMFYLHSRFGKFWQRFSWSVMRMQLSYAMPLGIAAFLSRAHSDLHNYFVSYRFGAIAFAIYAVGCFNFLLVDMLSEAVGSVMIPRVSYLQSVGAHHEIVELTARMIRKLAALFFPLCAFLLVTGYQLIVLLFTTQYASSWPIFAVNLTLIPLVPLALASDAIIRAYADHRFFLMKLRIPSLILLFLLLYAGTSRFGLVGAIMAVALITATERVVTAFKAARIVGARLAHVSLLKDTGKLAIAAAAAAILTKIVYVAVSGLRPLTVLIICGLLFSITYITAVLVLRVPSHEERAAVQDWLTNKLCVLWKGVADSPS